MSALLAHQACRAQASCRTQGFTLVEMVVALALLAMLVAGIFEALRFGQRTYSKVVNEGSASWEVLASQQFIRRVLESAYPQEPPSAGLASGHGLEGDSRTLLVTAPAVLAAGTTGLVRYEILLQPARNAKQRGTGNDLIVRWWPQSAGNSLASGAAARTEEVLLDGVAALHWSYLPPAATGTSVAESQWRDDWQGRTALPALIRLRVDFERGDARRWPELLVAPRITDDANCLFDIVAQRCRSVS